MSRLAGGVTELLTACLTPERLEVVVGGDDVRFQELRAVVGFTAQMAGPSWGDEGRGGPGCGVQVIC